MAAKRDSRSRNARNLRKYPPILFDEARRREFVDPSLLVDRLGVKTGKAVADFGAGAGFFTIPLARAVGRRGTVYAIDINPNNLSIVRGKAEHAETAASVTLVEGNIETGRGVSITPKSLDYVVVSSLLSQISGKKKVLALAEKLLAPGGRLVVFEWHQREMLLGPPKVARIAKEEVINLVFSQTRQFTLEQDMEAGFYHYGLVFLKAGRRQAK